MGKITLFAIFASLLFLVLGYKTYEQYHEIQRTQTKIVLNEGRALSEFIKAFRETYQNVFITNHIMLNAKTEKLLPVVTISEIGRRLSERVRGQIILRTVSDRPRNIINKTNTLELEMMQYFRDNPKKEFKLIKKGDSHFYLRPLRIDKSCLKCHGKREEAPPSIRNKYMAAYDYRLGDIRGLSNVEIKNNSIPSVLYANFEKTLVVTVMLYLFLLIAVYTLLRRLQKTEQKYTRQLEVDVEEKTHELVEQKNSLYHQAHHDALTGLPNRVLFLSKADDKIAQANRDNMMLSLLYIDVDNFKNINDSLGHSIGDQILIKTATLLKSIMAKDYMLARLGGDEFAIMLAFQQEEQLVSKLAQQILDILAKPITVEGHTLYITCSIGITLIPQDSSNIEDLLKYADVAMYKAKNEGANRYKFYAPEMTNQALERVVLEAELRRALENEEFQVYYQPQVDAASETQSGMEALIRWQHPDRGLLLPNAFITLAEETGLIVAMDQWMATTAMRQVRQWRREGLDTGILALNLSIRHLMDDHFIPILQESMKATGFKPEWLELEVSESEVMKNPEASIGKLEQISRMGIGIAIDDFGTGHSSLAYLKRLPVTILKIDQSFIRGLPDDSDDVAIVMAIMALVKSLDLEIIAEGVETDAQKEFLLQYDNMRIQGYLFSRPLSVDKMEEMLKG